MKMILNLEIRGMKMRMEMKRNKMRMLLCVTKMTRLHCFWGKIYYWCTKENICLWEADGEMTTMGLVLSYSSVGKSFVLGKANRNQFQFYMNTPGCTCLEVSSHTVSSRE